MLRRNINIVPLEQNAMIFGIDFTEIIFYRRRTSGSYDLQIYEVLIFVSGTNNYI